MQQATAYAAYNDAAWNGFWLMDTKEESTAD